MTHTSKLLLLIGCLLAPLAAQSGSAGDRTLWTPRTIVFAEQAGSWQFSRDGQRLLWIETNADSESDRYVSKLMIRDLPDGKARALTAGHEGFSSPLFSPDGRRIAFLSSRPFPKGMKPLGKKQSGAQVWVLPLNGGEARPLTRIAHGVGGFRWIDDQNLLLSARDPLSHRELRDEKAKDGSIVTEDEVAFLDSARHLFRFRLEGARLERIGDDRHPVGSLTVSRDGRRAVVTHHQSPHFTAEERIPPRVWLYDLQDGGRRELFAARKGKPRALRFAPDGESLFAVLPHSSVDGEDSGAIQIIAEIRCDDLAVSEVPLGWEWGVTYGFAVCEDGFVAGLCNGVRPRMARYQRQADGRWLRSFITSPHGKTIHDLRLAPTGDRAVVIEGSASDPDHVLLARLKDDTLLEAKEIHRPAKGFAGHAIAKTSIVHWKGSDGETVEGILFHPHDDPEATKRPLILITHGGPHGADTDRFSERWANTPNFYAQRGAYVLQTNYHGSSDYGLRFGESIKGRYYEHEVTDLLSGIRHLEERGLVDRERLGLVGWSNGAILSIAAITHQADFAPGYDYRFKVCVPGAGDVNWSSDYGNCAFGAAFDDFYLGGPPWKIPDVYRKKSPLFRVETMEVPTLIFFGTKDRAVPTEQGWQWFRALRRVGKAPVRFVQFPGEPHGLRKPSHRMRKLEEELAWVDRYLFDKKPDSTPKLADTSPLRIARAMEDFARHEGHYGEVVQGFLVPETIPWKDGIEISRFTITRAQWQAFRADEVAGPQPELPRVGLQAADAETYVRWLSKLLGRKVRLLTTKEWKTLSKNGGARENTLDFWTGYAAPPHEAEILSPEVMALGVDRILRPAGRTPPARLGKAKALVYDLGGNAGTWVRDGDGKLVRRGLCAATRQQKGVVSEPPASLTGLRIAIDP